MLEKLNFLLISAHVIASGSFVVHVGHGSKSMQFAFLSFNYRMAIFGSKGIRELGFVLDNPTPTGLLYGFVVPLKALYGEDSIELNELIAMTISVFCQFA